MAEFHVHPDNPTQIVYGDRLKQGEIIKLNDVYDSAHGVWKKSPIVGLPIRSKYFYWVRPR